MYDANREAKEFFAQSREDAVAKACQYFDLEEDGLSIWELPSGEVYGAAGRAVLVAEPKGRGPRPPAEARGRDHDGGRGDGGERPARRDRGDRGDRGGRGGRGGGGRGRGERSDRGDRGGRDRGERGGGRGERAERGGRGEGSERGDGQRASRDPGPDPGPSVGTAQGKLSDVGTFVLGLMERMGLGSFDISESEENDLLVIELRGTAAASLVATDARAPDAVQLLANQVAVRNSEEKPPRVVIDVEGSAEAREDVMEGLAQRVAGRARDTGRAVALDPMNGRDRRLIHLALRDEEDIATMSVGEGRYRQVLVVPEGAPEFEEALREADRAASQDD